jgi:LmbE family N-acetylglucosaminyl deacetylase
MKMILSIGAHPDDIEIGCGGYEILLQQRGCRIIHVIVTSGEEGGLSITKDKLKQQREAEALNSAKVIGAEEVIFLRYPDGCTVYDKEMKIRLITIIREYKPDIIFTHASSDTFPDHKVVSELTMAAITAAAGPWYPDAGIPPHKVSHVYGYEVWHPMQQHQLAVSIEGVMAKKIEALRCHNSQLNAVDYMAAVKGLAAYRGVMSMQGRFAEVFEVICSESTYG